MTEATEMKIEEIEEVVEKAYTFRKLKSTDVFLMFQIISKIGINEFMACLENDSLKAIVNMFATNNAEEDDEIYMMASIAGALEIANVIIGNLPKCEREIFQMLANTSNLSEKDIKAMDMVSFIEMVIDFIKKEEFKDFIKVVSRLFK